MSKQKQRTQTQKKTPKQSLNAVETRLLSDLGKAGSLQSISEHLRPQKFEAAGQRWEKFSLAKANASFLQQLLTSLRKKLTHHKLGESSVAELFEIYRLYVSCVDKISGCLRSPVAVLHQKCSMLECFEKWERWDEGSTEAYTILESLHSLFTKTKASVLNYLPDPDCVAGADSLKLVVDTVGFLFLFAAKKESMYLSHYYLVYQIAKDFQSWLRVLDDQILVREAMEKQARHLTSCTIFFIREVFQWNHNHESYHKPYLNRASELCVLLKEIPGNPYLTDLCDSLYQIGHGCQEAQDFKKASETLKLHLQTTWDTMEGQLKESETHVQKRRKTGEEIKCSDYGCLEWFGRWCEGSTLLIQVLRQYERCDEVQKTIISWAEKWAETFSDKLPGPISLVEQWVEIQITNRVDESVDNGGSLFGTLIQPCSKVSRKKIFQQEFLFYVQMQHKNPRFCKDMQMKIKNLLKEDGFGEPIEWLVESGDLRQCGIRCLKYSIQYLSQAIKDCSGYLLAVAYFLRSLCTEDQEPNSPEVFKDIRYALVTLSTIPTSDVHMMPGNLMKIIYNIFDMLSLKGRIDFHFDIYKVMSEIYTRRQVPENNLLVNLWKSRRLSHALCPSPVQEAFMSLLNTSGKELELTVFCRECPSKSQPLTESDVAGYQYYDLCENLVSNGRLIEAFPYALKAHHLREELFKKKFPFPFEQHGKSVASELWNFESSSSELDDRYISPWLALQLHAESILQVGVIHEVLGNGAEAEKFLDRGKFLSCSHSSTLFDIVFSSCLGQLYRKKKDWASAKKQLQSAEKLLKDSITDGFCLKCRVAHEVTVSHSLLDLYQSCDCETESRSFEELSNAYKTALSKLTIFSPEEQDGCVIGHADNSQVRGSSECVFLGCGEMILSWDLDLQRCAVPFEDGAACICNSMGCLHCNTKKAKSGSVTDYIKLKWELAYRCLSLKLLRGLGECLENDGQIFEACEVVLQSISVLVGPNPFFRASKSTFLPDTIRNEISAEQKHMNLYHLLGRETREDVVRVERAVILYNLCWLSLKYRKHDTSNNPHMVLNIPISNLVSWLMLAFVLCREVPALFQKVSRLLATLFSLSTSSVLQDALSTSCKDLCGRDWVCFFHQVSLGSQFNYKLFIKDIRQCADTKGSHMASGEESLPRLAPDSIVDIEPFVKKFFEDLPCTSVICISVLDCPYANLLENLLSCSSAPAWMMVSRLNHKNRPIHVLLPLQLLTEDDSVKNPLEKIPVQNKGGQWHCPWGRTVVDVVAPNFRSLLEEQEHCTKFVPPSDPAGLILFREKALEARSSLESRLSALLRNLEESWFGTLKYLLLGESSNSTDLDTICANLKSELSSEFKDIDPSLLKVIVFGVSKYGFEGDTEQVMLNFCLMKGCYVDDHHSKDQHSVERLRGFGSKVCEAVEKVKKFEASVEPIILVPHFDIQMLPWECIPVLKMEEVYRMPSVWSISAAYTNDRKINPLKAYYVSDADGSLKCKFDFEKLFSSKMLKGMVGSAPSAEELAAALEDQDVFIYIGHNDASQYIPNHKIEGLRNCPGALLMGCSSASLQLNGCYVPDSAPLSYLFAGSPFIFGNLWNVVGDEIDDFTVAMLDSWFRFSSDRKDGDQRLSIGACMSIARDQCKTWPYLVGAAPVCYGVPRELKRTIY